MLDLPASKEINTQMGKGEGGGLLSKLGDHLNKFALGLEGLILGIVTLNGEAKTPVVFGDDQLGELLSDPVGATGHFDISSDTTVTFTVDGVNKTEITFAANDLIADLNEATPEEIVAFMQEAIETAVEDDDYWVEVVGSGEERQIRVYSLEEDMTDNKIAITEQARENSTLGFDNGDSDLGKKGIGLDIEYDGNYAIFTSIMDAETGESIGIDDIESGGFSLICSDTGKDYEIAVMTLGKIA